MITLTFSANVELTGPEASCLRSLADCPSFLSKSSSQRSVVAAAGSLEKRGLISTGRRPLRGPLPDVPVAATYRHGALTEYGAAVLAALRERVASIEV